MYDSEPNALVRTKEVTYPSRYGDWDHDVVLRDEMPKSADWDLIIIGTPPDTHVELALAVLSSLEPKILLIEKPLCSPNHSELERMVTQGKTTKTKILVGYNHLFTTNTLRLKSLLNEGYVGKPQSIHVRWLEHWGGIFDAHPWLAGPSDSYLGSWKRGGGSCGEHSHGISLWQHCADLSGAGRIVEVSAHMKIVESESICYDETSVLSFVTENGVIGSVIQDVVTSPPEKMLRIQGVDGYVEWYANYDGKHDAIRYGNSRNPSKLDKFSKHRPDDFTGEISHIQKMFDNQVVVSPNDLDHGVQTMRVVVAAYESNMYKKSVTIDL